MGKKWKAVMTTALAITMITISFTAAGQNKAEAGTAKTTEIAKTIVTVKTTPTIMSIVKATSQVKTTSEEYITVEEYAKVLMEAVRLELSQGSEGSGDINILIENGIIKEGDFTSYTKNLTRGDALVLLNRADEYLNKDTIDAALVQKTIDKRISDITKVSETKRKDVAEAYLKGFMKGFTNGEYCTDRKLKLTSKITKIGALESIRMLTNKKLRAKISPDGQLIRTTKLPKYAKYYPYILASFPNEYYDQDFGYENVTAYNKDGNLYEMKSLFDYFVPVDIDKITVKQYKGKFITDKKADISKWVEKATSYAEHIFNVDYHTINDNWKEEILATSIYYESPTRSFLMKNLNLYMEKMIAAKTIVKSKSVSIDGSSLYYFNGAFYLRARVKYQIVSTLVPSVISQNTFIDEGPYAAVIFSTGYPDLRGYTANKWVEGYFNVCLTKAWNEDETLCVSSMDIYENKMEDN